MEDDGRVKRDLDLEVSLELVSRLSLSGYPDLEWYLNIAQSLTSIDFLKLVIVLLEFLACTLRLCC